MARLLLTRMVEESAHNARLITQLGHEPVLVPLRICRALSPDFSGLVPDALIATSGNVFANLGQIPASFRYLPLYVVGKASAKHACKAGFTKIKVADGNAESLATLIEKHVPQGADLLYLAGQPRRALIETRLSTGYTLRIRECYAIEAIDPPPMALKAALDQPCDAVLHFSAQSAQTYFAAARSFDRGIEAAKPLQACLSQAIADAVLGAIQHEKPALLIPERPNAESMIEATLKAIAQRASDV